MRRVPICPRNRSNGWEDCDRFEWYTKASVDGPTPNQRFHTEGEEARDGMEGNKRCLLLEKVAVYGPAGLDWWRWVSERGRERERELWGGLVSVSVFSLCVETPVVWCTQIPLLPLPLLPLLPSNPPPRWWWRRRRCWCGSTTTTNNHQPF